mgnify:CR=1 FL=1
MEQSRQDVTAKREKTGNEIALLEQEIAGHNEAIAQAKDANTDVVTQEERFQTLLEQNNIKKVELTKRILENKTQTAGLQEILDREQSNLQEITDKIQALDDAGAELAHSVKHLQGQTEQLNLERRETERQYHMDHSRLRSLQNMTERYEGFGQSIKRVMEQKPNYPGIVGVVADIIRVNKAFAGAHIEKGTHKIEFRFSPPGKQIGCIISLISLLCYLSYLIFTFGVFTSRKTQKT